MAEMLTDTALAAAPNAATPDMMDASAGETRQKFGNRGTNARRLQRISSSPSLVQFGRRARVQSSPYSRTGSFSCISLSSATCPFAPASPAQTTAEGSSGAPSDAATRLAETADHEGISSVLCTRLLANEKDASSTAALPLEVRSSKKRFPGLWKKIPQELKMHILSFLQPRELARISRVCKEFHGLCYDGQLWPRLDASGFYRDIPADSLAKMIAAAGPFVRHLNLRGCVQLEHCKRAEMVVKACKNLVTATLEGCRNLQRTTLHSLVQANHSLTLIDLTGLVTARDETCNHIAESCPQLEVFNVSWCKYLTARGIKAVVDSCPRLRDLRAGEIKGFDKRDVAESVFRARGLERLVLAGCQDLGDSSLQTMMHGLNPDIDLVTGRPVVPPRKLRHLDLSRCTRLTDQGVKALGYNVPKLEALRLLGLSNLTDAALETIVATTPRLRLLELEDLGKLSNAFLSEHLAKAPCAPRLQHLSISACDSLGDVGMLPVLRSCTNLTNIDMDNTRVSDLVLAEASAMVRARAAPSVAGPSAGLPKVGLSMAVFDCPHVTWLGVLEVLARNTQTRLPGRANSVARLAPRLEEVVRASRATSTATSTYPSEIIALRCFYGWQMTVDEHTKRVLRGDFGAAERLGLKWSEFQQANEEAGMTRSGSRRRRRRAREAAQVHVDEEGGAEGLNGRRRARTAVCVLM